MKLRYQQIVSGLVVWGCTSVFSGYAADAPTAASTMGLSEAVELAVEQNLDILLAEERSKEAEAVTKTVRSRLLPTITGGASQQRHERSAAALGFTGGNFDNSILNNVFDARVRGTAPIVDLKAYHEFRSSEGNEELTRLQEVMAREEIAMGTALLFCQILRDREALSYLEENAELKSLRLQLVEDMEKTGVATPLDVSESELLLATARSSLRSAQSAAHRSKVQLKRLLNVGLQAAFEPAGELHLADMPLLPFDAAVELALEQRSDFLARKQEEAVAIREREAARAAYYPVLDVFGDFGTSGEDPGDDVEVWMVGVGLDIPIWDSYARLGALEQKRSIVTQSENRVQDLEEDIRSQVSTLLEDVPAQEEVARVAKKAVEVAEERLTVAEDRFETGDGTELDVVEAKVDLANARFENIEELLELYRLRIEWFRALGRLDTYALAGEPPATKTNSPKAETESQASSWKKKEDPGAAAPLRNRVPVTTVSGAVEDQDAPVSW